MARQITSSEVIERLVESARSVRDAPRRHEALGLCRRLVGQVEAKQRARLEILEWQAALTRDRYRVDRNIREGRKVK